MVREYLTQTSRFLEAQQDKGDRKYGSYEGFVLAEGREMPWRPLPSSYSYGPLKMCFENAVLLATRYDLTYCEGYAAGIIPCLHAWCIDDEGYVIDNTWSEEIFKGRPRSYYGIAFNTERVVGVMINRGYYGIIGNDWMFDTELLRKGVGELGAEAQTKDEAVPGVLPSAARGVASDAQAEQ